MGNLKKTIIASAFITLLTLLAPMNVLAAAGSANVGAPGSLNQGAHGTATVGISGSNIGAFEFSLGWSGIGSVTVTALSPSGVTVFASGSSISGFSATGTNGGAIATISFTVTGPPGGVATIDIDGTMNSATSPYPPFTPMTFTGATININPLPPTTTTTPPTTTTTPPTTEITTRNLNISVTGNGTTSPSPGIYDLGTGDVVPLKATAAAGSYFVNWSGNVLDRNSANTSINMSGNQIVVANFALDATPTTTAPPTTTVPPTTTTTPPTTTTTPPVTTTAPPTTTTVPPTSTAPSTTSPVPPTSTVPPTTTSSPPVTTTNPQQGTLIISKVGLVQTSATEADITWTTNASSDSQVEYWVIIHQATPLDTRLVTEHKVHITNLSPGTVYTYKIMSRDGSGNLATIELQIAQAPKASSVVLPLIIIGAILLLGILLLGIFMRGQRGKGINGAVPPSSPIAVTPIYPIAPIQTRVERPAEPVAPAPRPIVREAFVPPLVKPAENKYVPPAPPQETVKPVEAERAKEAAVPTPKTVEPPKMPVHYNEITVKLTKGDFTLTPAAVEKLSASSQPSAGGEPRVLRITRLPGTPVQLRMFVDKQGPNDIGVLNNDLRILFLSPEAAEMLGGIVIDYQTTGTGGEFALSKKKTV